MSFGHFLCKIISSAFVGMAQARGHFEVDLRVFLFCSVSHVEAGFDELED